MDTGKEDTSFRSPTALFFQIIGKHLEREKLKGGKGMFFFFSQFREMQSIWRGRDGEENGAAAHIGSCIRSQRVKHDGA